MIVTSVHYCSHLAIGMLLVTLMEPPFEKYVVCVITPFICQLIHKGELSLSEVIQSLCEGAISTVISMKQAPLFTHLLAMIVSVSPLGKCFAKKLELQISF